MLAGKQENRKETYPTQEGHLSLPVVLSRAPLRSITAEKKETLGSLGSVTLCWEENRKETQAIAEGDVTSMEQIHRANTNTNTYLRGHIVLDGKQEGDAGSGGRHFNLHKKNIHKSHIAKTNACDVYLDA